MNQAWSGHPGSLVRTLVNPPPPPAPGPVTTGTYAVGVKCEAADKTQQGWTIAAGLIKNGPMCLDAKDKKQLRLAACDGSANQKFTPNAAKSGHYTGPGGGCLDIFGSSTCMPVVDRRVDLFPCNDGTNQAFDFTSATGAPGDSNGAYCLMPSNCSH